MLSQNVLLGYNVTTKQTCLELRRVAIYSGAKSQLLVPSTTKYHHLTQDTKYPLYKSSYNWERSEEFGSTN